MFRLAIHVTCMVLLALVFYDVLSYNHLSKTQTYKCIKQVGSSKYGKMLLKKLKKAKRKYLKSLDWPLRKIPTETVNPGESRIPGETVNQLGHYVHLVDWPMNLKNNAISFIHYALTYLNKNASFQYLSSLSLDDIMKMAKAGVAVVFQQVQKCAATTGHYMSKVMLPH